ncbi:hypothetical protein [Kitasatospora sp. GAS1066B]|uniref:hypothetical protein n=1 Tax=Kitasatospora sp. GAS1066B TaxID=3156271 RepID=UPI0035119056
MRRRQVGVLAGHQLGRPTGVELLAHHEQVALMDHRGSSRHNDLVTGDLDLPARWRRQLLRVLQQLGLPLGNPGLDHASAFRYRPKDHTDEIMEGYYLTSSPP